MPGAVVEAERHQQHVAGQPLDGPRGELRGGRPGAEARLAEHRQARAHLDHRAPRQRASACCTRAKREGLPAADQRGRGEQQREQHDRGDGGEHERVLAARGRRRRWRTSPSRGSPGRGCSAGSVRRGCRAPPGSGRAPVPRAATGSARARARPAGPAAWRTSARRSWSRGRCRAGARACPGRAARRIACQASARMSIEAHMSANATSTHTGVAATIGAADRLDADVVERQRREARGRRPRRRAMAARRATRTAVRVRRAGHRRARSRAAAAAAPDSTGASPRRAFTPSRARHLDRVAVGLEHLVRHPRPGEALGALARGGGHALAAGRGRAPSDCRASPSAAGSAAGTRIAVDAVAHHVAVAGDVRGHHGRRGCERLREHHAEALAAQRRRAEDVRLAEQAPLLLVGHAPGHDARPRSRAAAARPPRRSRRRR